MSDLDDIMTGLDPEQRVVASSTSGPLVVLAGAGTGKTRAITHRIAYSVASGAHDARRTLAVTFTNRAAGEMRSRLTNLGVDGVAVRTFHAAALRQLTYFWPRLVGGSFPELVSSKAKFVVEAAAKCHVPTDAAMIRDLAAEIEWAKVSQVAPDAFNPTSRTMPGSLSIADVARVYSSYEDVKTKRGAIDFEDVLLLTVGMLESRPDIADEVQAQYRWFTVDEYQDISPLQHRLLDAWLGERDELCVVGDASQTIYSFTGATSDYLVKFGARYPNATEVSLVRCYRCTPQIVAVANTVIAGSDLPKLELVSQREAGPIPQVRVYDDETAEAEAVANEIRKLTESGVALREIAVLYRINAQSQVYEEALAELHIPVQLRGSERFFERAEVREAITRIRGAARGGTDGDVTDQVRAVLAAAGWSQTAPAGSGAVRERWESLSALVTLAQDLVEAEVVSSLADLVTELDRRAEAQHAPQSEAVTLASLHSAKGLEWDAVFIVGCNEGMLPISYADTSERIKEERRLFYVGVTRARTHLEISASRARQPGARATREPSRFLSQIASSVHDTTAISASVRKGSGSSFTERKRKGPAACRVCGKSLVTAPERTIGRCRTCPSSADEALIDQLKVWRLEMAEEHDVPAYVIFTDATLTAIAEQLPSTKTELLAISGIGPAKLERFGDALLALLADA